ncbi:MAG TPA: LamG-like jellyroll fold domain-containing protein, partial [Pseudonocardiaceae bacterium]
GAGELAAYAPGNRHQPTGPSATRQVGFDRKTSIRIAAKSTATVNYFQNADGSVTRKYSQTPVNYRDSAGNWQPIDTAVRWGTDGRWHETANSLAVDFAQSSTDPALARFTVDGTHSIAYRLAGAAAVTADVSGPNVTYRNVLPGSDLRVAPTATGMKESVILHSATAATSWVFPLTTQGVHVATAPDGTINVIDGGGAIVARLPRAYATDSKVDPRSGEGATTYAVSYALTDLNGTPALRMSLDPAWLADPARVFPVYVDPSFATGGASTYTEAGNGVAPGDHSTENAIKIGSFDIAAHIAANTFLQFPKDLDGSGVQVTGASLALFDTWASTCTAERFDVAGVTQSWTPSGVTTYPGPSFGGSIGNLTPSVPHACANTTADRTVGDWVSVPLSTGTIQAWANSSSPDFGLAVFASLADDSHWKQFDSSNLLGLGPQLQLTTNGNVPPQVDSQYPGNGGVAATLTPELIATGHDLDNAPNPLQYRFQIYNSADALVVDSGLVGNGDWTVPAGKLAFGQTYYWTVQSFDGASYSTAPGWNSLSIQVPQPLITSSLSQNHENHGVDASIGNYTTSATDAQVATMGPSLSVQRDYNSRDPRNTGAFGAGWSALFDARAAEQRDAAGNLTSVVVTYPDGSQVGYGRNADGTFAPPQGRFATLKPLSGGGYSLTDKNDTAYAFAQSLTTGVSGITSITDANGRAENVTWTSGQISAVTSAVSGRALHLTWATPTGATAAHVATVATDPVTSGQSGTALIWTYNYTGDQLASVCPPGTTTACTQYTYTTASQYQNLVTDVGPHSFWPFAESSGAAANSTVLANEGSDVGTYSNVTLGQPGPLTGGPATSAGFNGTSSSVQLARSLVSGASTESWSLWFKTSTPNGVLLSYSNQALSYAPTAPGGYTPALYIGSDGRLFGELWVNAVNPIASSVSVADGAWHNVVLSASGNTQQMFLDGHSVGSLSGTISTLGMANDYVGAGFLGGNWPDQPHFSANTTGFATYFAGSIADVGFYTKPLDAGTVSALYASGTRSASLLTSVARDSGKPYATVSYNPVSDTVNQLTDENGGVWKLAPSTVSGSSQVYRSAVLGSGPNVYYRLGDTAGAAQPFDEVNGGPATYANTTLGGSGPFSDATAAGFNGSSSGISLPSYLIQGANNLTAELWFRTTSSAAGMLLSTGNSSLSATNPSSGAMPVLYVGTDGKLYGHFWNTNVTGMASAGRVNDGNWHHVVLTGAVNTQTLYLDGQQAGTEAGALANVDPLDFVGAGVFNPNGWAAAPGNTAWNYFNGSISDVAIYHSALTAPQVSAHYQAAHNSQGLAPMTTALLTDPGNKTLTYQYDTLNGNRQIARIDGLGNRTSYGYDTSGFLYTVTDPNGDVTTTGHDVRGNTVSQTTCQNQAAGTCATAYYSFYPDDTTAQLTTADPRNDVMLTVRDGRSASATDGTYLTSYSYDAAGDRTGVTTPPVPGFPSGRTTAVTYSDGTATYPAADGGNVPPGLPVRTTSPGGAVNAVS